MIMGAEWIESRENSGLKAGRTVERGAEVGWVRKPGGRRLRGGTFGDETFGDGEW